jgi:DNA polymerase-3 subunit delta
VELNPLLDKIRKKEFEPVYLLHGEESYFIDTICDAIEANALSEEERAFNQTVLYGKDATHTAVLDSARRFPMMAPRQLVLLKEAQEMKDLDMLKSYVEKPAPTTVLVICYKYKRLAMNTSIGKTLSKHALVFEAKKLYDNKIPAWVTQYLKQARIDIDGQTAATIAEHLGTDLSKVANELDKLKINLPAGSSVTAKHIEEYIGISREYNVFELQKALGERDTAKVFRIVQNFAANPKKNPFVLVISNLYNFFSKVYMLHFLRQASDSEIMKSLKVHNAFFLKDYRIAARNYPLPRAEKVLALLHEYDLKSKGVDFNSTNTDEGELLRELAWRILHDGTPTFTF